MASQSATLVTASSTSTLTAASVTSSSVLNLKTVGGYAWPLTVFNPVAAAVSMVALGAVMYGGSNLIQVLRKKKQCKTAAIDTVKDTVGIGVAGTLGFSTAAAVTVLGSAVVLPAIVGIGVTIATKKLWDRMVSRDSKSSKR